MKLKNERKQPGGIVRFLAGSPLATEPLDLTRKPDYGRTIDLEQHSEEEEISSH